MDSDTSGDTDPQRGHPAGPSEPAERTWPAVPVGPAESVGPAVPVGPAESAGPPESAGARARETDAGSASGGRADPGVGLNSGWSSGVAPGLDAGLASGLAPGLAPGLASGLASGLGLGLGPDADPEPGSASSADSAWGPGELAEIEEIVGHRFADPSLLELAFRHASASESRLASNERLEFLGDALLGAVVCEQIFEMLPRALEGEMTKIKSTAVSRKTCAAIARRLGLDKRLVLGKGMQGQGRMPSSLAAAVLEAVVAAVYLDAGYAEVRGFLRPLFAPLIEEAVRSGHQSNFKSVLQQHAQQSVGQAPQYRVLDEKGPDHAKAFKIAVELAGKVYEASWGQSKKQAEQQAALNALRALGVAETNDRGETVVNA